MLAYNVRKAEQKKNVSITYIFCDYKDAQRQTEVAFLLSLVKQLIEQIRTIPPEVESFCDQYEPQKYDPSKDALIDLLKCLSGHFEKTFVFIDALVFHVSTLFCRELK